MDGGRTPRWIDERPLRRAARRPAARRGGERRRARAAFRPAATASVSDAARFPRREASGRRPRCFSSGLSGPPAGGLAEMRGMRKAPWAASLTSRRAWRASRCACRDLGRLGADQGRGPGRLRASRLPFASFVDLAEARRRIKALPLVAEASVRKLYPEGRDHGPGARALRALAAGRRGAGGFGGWNRDRRLSRQALSAAAPCRRSECAAAGSGISRDPGRRAELSAQVRAGISFPTALGR